MFLAGGFGASPWIFQEVGRGITDQGLKLSRPDTHTYVCLFVSVRSILYVSIRNKAVAAGAISYYIDNFVVGRLVRYTYGTPASIPYDPSDPEHRKRAHKKYLGITGVPRLDIFSPTLFKVADIRLRISHLGLTNSQGMRVSGTQEFRDEVAGVTMMPPVTGRVLKFSIIRYTGNSKKPLWMDEEQGRWPTQIRCGMIAS